MAVFLLLLLLLSLSVCGQRAGVGNRLRGQPQEGSNRGRVVDRFLTCGLSWCEIPPSAQKKEDGTQVAIRAVAAERPKEFHQTHRNSRNRTSPRGVAALAQN